MDFPLLPLTFFDLGFTIVQDYFVDNSVGWYNYRQANVRINILDGYFWQEPPVLNDDDVGTVKEDDDDDDNDNEL